MDREEFKASVAELVILLEAIRVRLPKYVDEDLVRYLRGLKDDPCGLTLLMASIEPKK
jgi:hypothetical protein